MILLQETGVSFVLFYAVSIVLLIVIAIQALIIRNFKKQKAKQ